MSKSTRGGHREGAGRPPEEPTRQLRIPESLVDKVLAMVKKHKSRNRLSGSDKLYGT